MNVCCQKPTDFLQLMVNAHIDDSEADEVSVNESAGTVVRWSRKGTLFVCTAFYAFSLGTC